jgi:23S rRNA (adenine2503-C2)-methyltransferase
MKILEKIEVPTGHILIANGEKHKPLEFLSIGDYGKNVNLTRKKVENQEIMPLSEKWVLTISTQYGCSMKCNFCDVPAVGPGINATFYDLINQIISGLNLHPEIRSKRLNIHFARMGEPTWNPSVLDCAKWIYEHIKPEHDIVHPVVSTMMPSKNIWLKTFIHTWMRIKNRLYRGEAGLQLSINSTSEKERKIMFNNKALSLPEIAKIMDGIVPYGRKITLNFAVADYEVDPTVLLRYFNPELYIIKLTPMHKTLTAQVNRLKTAGDYTNYYPYEKIDQSLQRAGYDVLVFIASEDEDKSRITCGNAILSDNPPQEG